MWTCILKPGHIGPCQPAPDPECISARDRRVGRIAAFTVLILIGIPLAVTLCSILVTLQ